MRQSLSSNVAAVTRDPRGAGLRLLIALAMCVGGAVVLPAVAVAQEDAVPGVECCSDMLYPVGARAVSMGQAAAARPGTEAMFINPAGLTDVHATQLVAHRSTVADGSMNTFSLLVRSRVGAVFGLTYTAFDYGEIAQTAEGPQTGRIVLFNQVLVASFATTLAQRWSAGVNYRLYHLGVTCEPACEEETSGTTSMLDAGVRYSPEWLNTLILGASLMHAGFPLQVNNAEQADFTPARLRIGAAYNASRIVTRDSSVAVWLHADVVQRVRDTGAVAVNFGAEVSLDNVIFFRAGHASTAEGITSGGNGAGIGVKYQRFDVSVAKSVGSSGLFADPVYVSFGISF